MNVENTIERQIRDYFNGKLSAAEEADLINWIKVCDENREYFINYKRNIDIHDIDHPLLESSFIELKNKLILNSEFNSAISVKTRRLQLSFARIAAMLLVALIAGFSVAYLVGAQHFSQNHIVWFKTYVPRGEKSQLILPDGSKVWVNSESTISYPNNFIDGRREIKLSGEAYFEVAKLENKPFVVKTRSYDIKVLGTKFNVMAYPDFDRIETSLIEGKIEIQKGEQTIPVVPGEIFTCSNDKYSIKEAKVDQTAKWKDNIFDFDQITFKELIARMERWYDVNIEIKSPELEGILYSGIFKNEETIGQALNTIQLTLPIQCTNVGFREFIIEKQK
jgi:ferric-dicitrate binding protein FerR (iron transport regulator)